MRCVGISKNSRRENIMDTKNLIKAINLGEGEVLTLEKAADRMEFEALPIMLEASSGCAGGSTNCACNSSNCPCNVALNCSLNFF